MTPVADFLVELAAWFAERAKLPASDASRESAKLARRCSSYATIALNLEIR